MADPKTESGSGGDRLSEDANGRRTLALALFGALGGAALVESCAAEPTGFPAPENLGVISAGVNGLPTDFCDTIHDLRCAVTPPGSGTKMVFVLGLAKAEVIVQLLFELGA